MTQVVSSISGLEIYSPSAGYAPTNSGDVSAIASGYQVVSSTATQLYAGTAYVTSVNGDALSAARAGNAANASLANSAYYDGTGRLISALPDAAAVSSIASSYAESAVSGKADSSSLSSYALSSDVSGVIDTVSSNSASWSGGSLPITGTSGDDTVTYDASSIRFTRYDTAGEPDIRTAMLTPDSLWMDYTLDGNDHTSMTLNESMLNFTLPDGDRYVDAYSIDTWNSAVDTVANNSASWGGGATGDYVEKSALAVTIGDSNTAEETAFSQGSSNTALSASFAQGYNNTAESASFAQGYNNKASSRSFAQGNSNTAYYWSLAQGIANSAYYYSLAQGSRNKASSYSFAQGTGNSASSYSFAQGSGNHTYDYSLAQGRGISAYNTAAVFGQYNLRGDGSTSTGNSAAFAIGDGTASAARHDLMLVTKDGEITMYSSTADTVGTGIMSSIRAISAAATGGGVDSATVSAIASSYAESAASSKQDSSAMSAYALSSNVSGVIDTVSANSASWTTDLTDYATTAYVDSSVSAKLDSSASSSFYTTANESGFVGSAYVDSAVSGKMDSSAIDYTRTGGGTQIYASGTGSSTNQFSAKNDSAGAAIIAGENARLRLWDTAATANLYASSIGGWNAASNLVSSQSANWGGSALALSAGNGITLSKSGDTLTINTETVLWSSTPVTVAAATAGLTLSDSPYNFDRVALYWVPWNYTSTNSLQKQEAVAEAKITSAIPRIGSITEWNAEDSNTMFIFSLNAYFDSSKFYTQAIKYFAIGEWAVNVNGNDSYITKIVGINRTAGV